MQDQSNPEEIGRLLDAIEEAATERGTLNPELDEDDGTVRGMTLRALDALRDYYRQEVGLGAYRLDAASAVFHTIAEAHPRSLVWLTTYAVAALGDANAGGEA
jgi:hypothetical protein